MGSLWRSEKMELAELFIQSEVRRYFQQRTACAAGWLACISSHTHTISLSLFFLPFTFFKSSPLLVLAELLCGLLCETTQSTTAI